MAEMPDIKSERLLDMYVRLLSGEVLNRNALSQEYGVTSRSVQRDVEALRCFLADRHQQQEVIYDRAARGYRLVSRAPMALTNSESLAVCKILLESRSMGKDEMFPILDKLISLAVPAEHRRAVSSMIANEKFHYIQPHHGQSILASLWELGQAVEQHLVLELEYERLKEPKLVKRRVLPVGLMFSEYYFYLTAFLEDRTDFENPDDAFPTIYRIDRIRRCTVLNEHFRVPYRDRFEEGEFRKRVQFMYGGRLERIRFRYTGPSLEVVLDRLPTAKILNEDDEGWTVEAEVFGKGIEMWLRSQGAYVESI